MYVYLNTVLFSLHNILEFVNKKELSGSSLSNILVLVKKIEFQGSYNLPKIMHFIMLLWSESIKYPLMLNAK